MSDFTMCERGQAIILIVSMLVIVSGFGNFIWEGYPIAEWVEIHNSWIPSHISQTAHFLPMNITADYPLGKWTWTYLFSEEVDFEGWFTVDEVLDGYTAIGVSDLHNSSTSGSKETVPDLGGESLSTIPVTRELAEEAAVRAFKENLIDPYDVKVMLVEKESVEHPMDSGNMTDAWHVVVSGKGTEKTSGELVTATTHYSIIIDTGEIIMRVTVGSGLSYISFKDVILDGIRRYIGIVLIGFGTIILFYSKYK